MKNHPLATIVPLGVLSVTLAISVLALNRCAGAQEVAICAKESASLNYVRIEHIGADIRRIEKHLDRLATQFDKIDAKFETIRKQMQTIMLYLPSRNP